MKPSGSVNRRQMDPDLPTDARITGYAAVQHRTTIEAGPEGRRVLCDCGRRSQWFRQQEELDRWERQHGVDVQRERNRPRRSNLRDGLDWYLERAEDPAEPEEQRVLWRQLADEITDRLNSKGSSEDVPLWTD